MLLVKDTMTGQTSANALTPEKLYTRLSIYQSAMRYVQEGSTGDSLLGPSYIVQRAAHNCECNAIIMYLRPFKCLSVTPNKLGVPESSDLATVWVANATMSRSLTPHGLVPRLHIASYPDSTHQFHFTDCQ